MTAQEVDRRFRHAVQLECEKDREYGYRHLTDLSGGLSLYAGITGGKRIMSHLDFDVFGMRHMGQAGDAILGAFLSGPGKGMYFGNGVE